MLLCCLLQRAHEEEEEEAEVEGEEGLQISQASQKLYDAIMAAPDHPASQQLTQAPGPSNAGPSSGQSIPGQMGINASCVCGHNPPCQFWQKAWGPVPAAVTVPTAAV